MEEMRSQDPAADCRECQTTAGTGGCDESHCDLFATCDKCCQLLCCCECWKECAECLVNSASRAPSFAACCTASELDLLCALCPQPVPSQSQPPLFPVPVRHPHFVHSHLIGASESGVSPMNIEWLLASPLGLGSTPPAFSPMQTPVYSADSPYQANTCGAITLKPSLRKTTSRIRPSFDAQRIQSGSTFAMHSFGFKTDEHP
ncbi:hypothetical protein BC830DRAFT_55978 [Chytriomyces sp. MP71]|nr:hypothetical protein BC830DRAFT_55978 [Chytriomyces sp. MP71]